MDNYTTKIFEIKDIDEVLIKELSSLYLDNYKSTKFEIFQVDLLDKDFIVCVFFENKVVGFSTLKNYIHKINGQEYSIIFSGDTIVHKDHWGQQCLAKEWIRLIKKIKELRPELELYWFLIVKGHRTYKYLNAFAKNYYPHVENKNDFLKDLSVSLAKQKFGDEFNSETGVVHFKENKASLIENLAEISDEQFKNTNTQFFLEKNPGYKNGDELVCCCSLETDNMNPVTLRIYKRA